MNRPSNGTDKRSLGDAITRHLAREALEPGELRQLMDMQEAVLAEPVVAPSGRSRSWYPAFAASAMLLAGFILIWQLVMSAPRDYTEQIALEVIENHLKLKPLDVASQSMDDIQDFFTQLDFSPINSRLLSSRYTLSESSVMGGRYCSIKGVTAAQLRYRRGSDGLTTLYEVAYDPEVFGAVPSADQGEAPRELLLKGLKVSLWVEKGLLLVLVSDA